MHCSSKIFISVGGWAAGGAIFSTLTSSAANRGAFISSVVQFCKTHSFDGIDIDWECECVHGLPASLTLSLILTLLFSNATDPVASDRGGNEADFSNYVTFMKELKAAAGNLGVTATLPSSYWYLRGFDIVNLASYVDWFNFMSYDIHGTWDGDNP